MSLTFGGRTADSIAKAAPQPGRPDNSDFVALARLDANAMTLWLDVAERDALRERMVRLADRLDDPALIEHPKWGEAWNRMTLMEGEMKRVIRSISDARHCVERDYRSLSVGGKDIVKETWGMRDDADPAEFVVSEAEGRNRLMPMVEVPF